jgi:hypothetical protein
MDIHGRGRSALEMRCGGRLGASAQSGAGTRAKEGAREDSAADSDGCGEKQLLSMAAGAHMRRIMRSEDAAAGRRQRRSRAEVEDDIWDEQQPAEHAGSYLLPWRQD